MNEDFEKLDLIENTDDLPKETDDELFNGKGESDE